MGNTFGSNGLATRFEPTCLMTEESQVVMSEVVETQ